MPAELVLALYVKHAVAKTNATQVFTDLVYGQGRMPITGAAPHAAHCRALGVALEAAVGRDFGAAHCAVGGLAITAGVVEELAKQHAAKLFAEHGVAQERLNEANRLGEIGRKEEIKRIFGIEPP